MAVHLAIALPLPTTLFCLILIQDKTGDIIITAVVTIWDISLRFPRLFKYFSQWMNVRLLDPYISSYSYIPKTTYIASITSM